jgi:hypothetical protein
MPRVALTLTATAAPNAPAGVPLVLSASDASSFNSFPSRGNDLVIAQNTDSVTRHVTIHSVADHIGRTGDLTSVAITAGQVLIFGPFPVNAWAQSDGNINVDTDNALVKLAVVHLP